MTSLDGSWGDRGIAHLAYNFEYTELALLQDLLYAQIRPSSTRRLAASEVGGEPLVGRIDPATFQRTLDPLAPMRRPLELKEIAAGDRPPVLLWVRFPNFESGFREEWLRHWYRPVSEYRAEHHGYALSAVEYARLVGPTR
ncbi:MAG: hypothetical protein JST92_21380 [Deltaproteobacteria bacterium]|nr:hypothetical protein [Deltaproteobacteria bacterium]